jgi:hypothetical protein
VARRDDAVVSDRGEPFVLESVLRTASYIFLTGVLLVVASVVPALTRRWPRVMLVGFLLAVASLFMVLAAALLLD